MNELILDLVSKNLCLKIEAAISSINQLEVDLQKMQKLEIEGIEKTFSQISLNLNYARKLADSLKSEN